MNQLILELKDGTILECPKNNNLIGLEELVPSINNLKRTNGNYIIKDINGEYSINANEIESVKIVF